MLLYNKRQENEEVQPLVKEKLGQHPVPGQIIMYCQSIKQTQHLAKVLGCEAYDRNIKDKARKRGILERLTTQTDRVFTATSALGVGIDEPSVHVVIHVGICRQLKDYSQESGRADWDGSVSEAIIQQQGTGLAR